jgi:sulfur-oxidizing protein SoxB
MKLLINTRTGRYALLSLALAVCSPASQALANDATLIMMGDLHGTLVEHAAVFKDYDGSETYDNHAGGLARLKTVVDGIRDDTDDAAVLLSVGDLTHGSAEVLFTVGNAMMPVMNAFDIDVFTPGNWDFGYGPAVFRHRFAETGPRPPVPANIRVMADSLDCSGFDPAICQISNVPPGPGGYSGIIKANFPAVAINLYNAPPIPAPPNGPQGKLVLPQFKIVDRDDVRIAVIGITAAIVPQQADVFNIGLRFTQGVEELPGAIAAAQGDTKCREIGGCVIVVQSELGMSQNLEIAKRFDEIDVMYSAHTHEITVGALVADSANVTRTDPAVSVLPDGWFVLDTGETVVVETNRDMYVGRLDLEVDPGGDVTAFRWEAIPVDSGVDEDEDMAALVLQVEKDFIAGPDFKSHTFMPGGFCPANNCGDTTQRGLQLVDGLDTVVGYTDTLLLRHHVLEDTLNNFLADAVLAITSDIVAKDQPSGWGGVDISMSNGFRFGNAVLPPLAGDNDRDGSITLRDLYTWFPVGPAVNIAEFAGQALEKSMNEILGAVFDRNPFLQRGGWYLGLANMTQEIDLDHRPFSSSVGRIVETRIGGVPLDPSKRYVFASCYAHGDAIDRVCRTGGGSGHQFFELKDGRDYASKIKLVDPVNDLNIVAGATIKQVAPDRFLHPVHALRRYLDEIGTVKETDFRTGRVATVDSRKQVNGVYPPLDAPVPDPDPTFVQPPQGAGPAFFSGRVD